jgi:D-tyrosyl-tRNA(Tyr) deacylase
VRAVVQRVKRASVTVGGDMIAEIGRGLAILLGVGSGDTAGDAEWLANKCAGLRVFEDDQGLMNLDLAEVGGDVLVVSQFTLYGDCGKGRRPSFVDAASPEKAEELYDEFVRVLRGRGIRVETGKFRAKMAVETVNDGPVTLLIER